MDSRRLRQRLNRACLTMAAAWLVAGGAAVQAATITVCPDGCDHATISAAILAADEGDTVLVGAGTYRENIALDRSIRVRGVSSTATIVDGGGAGAVFWVTQGVVATISDMTITGGRRDAGAGILNQGALNLRDAVVSGNAAPEGENTFGGGVYNYGGALSIRSVTFEDNEAGYGGAILNAGTLVVGRATLRNNTARAGGGAVYNYSGTALINNSVIVDNHTATRGGGAFFNAGALAIANSTVARNTSAEFGGAVFAQAGGVYVTNSTFSANDGAYGGGGIYLLQGEGAITSSTFFGNRGAVGGALNVQLEGRLSILNTIVAQNGSNCFGELRSEGANIDSGVTCNFSAPGDQTSTDARLRPLAGNGGFTLTHALPAGSPAIDQGDLIGCIDYVGYYLATDQRGYVRDVDGNIDGDIRCDVGAYEYDPADPGAGGATPTPGRVDGADLTACPTNGDHATIAAAIAAVRSGGTVAVCAATFEERLTIDKPLTLKGLGASVSVIKGGAGGPVLTIVGDVAVTVSDLTISGGEGIANPGGRLTLRRCTVTEQSARERGAVQSGGTLLVEGCRIADNVSLASGGGIAVDGGQATVRNSVIEGNTAGDYGGGIVARGGTGLALENVTVTGNEAANGGGVASTVPLVVTGGTLADNFGAYGAGLFSRGKATLNDTVISGNQGDLGGGIYAAGELNLTGAQVFSNFAFGAYGYGGGVMLNEGTLTVIRGALTDNQAYLGGGLYVRGTATVTDVANTSNDGVLGGGAFLFDGRFTSHGGRIAANAAFADGGGLYAEAGTVTMDATMVTENTAVRDGGGLFVQPGATAQVGAAQLANNTASSGGGAVNLGALTLVDMRVTGNEASGTEPEAPEGEDPLPIVGGDGGALLNAGTATVQRALIAEGEARRGAGVSNRGTIGFENVTFSGNAALLGGGGLHNTQGTATLRNVTFAANDTDPAADGGGAILAAAGSTVRLGHSLIAAGAVADACKGTMASDGYNLATDASCALGGPSDRASVALLLGPLAANGGPSPTHGLLDGSPAVDAGAPGGCPSLAGAPLAVDQRGAARPVDGNRDGVVRCDLGAFERAPAVAPGDPTATPGGTPPAPEGAIYLPILRRDGR